MTSQDSLLGKLLNDESFLRWLNGNATPESKKEWERWFLKNPEHRRIVEKAKKFLTMPFKTIPRVNDKSEQLYRLQKKVLELNKNSEDAREK